MRLDRVLREEMGTEGLAWLMLQMMADHLDVAE